jgi:dihydrofolate synthase/folylpolyglutamate synthase
MTAIATTSDTLSDKYQATINFLYSQTPQFQQIGAAAYKPGLQTIIRLSEAFGNPHQQLKAIHVAGTNGKGSTAHSIAAVLQKAGYKVGLFTSPHLIDFRERIKINGEMIPRSEVTEFVDKFKALSQSAKAEGETLEPSFFEITTVMAFDWFARCGVDYAVIEVGLGGRLDSTNILTPLLSVITNISFDHMAQLGNTLASIASEKAGIIKPEIPVVIGEAEGDVKRVFTEKAASTGSHIDFADCEIPAKNVKRSDEYLTAETPFGPICYGLTGYCQDKNLQTIITALLQMRNLGIRFSNEAVAQGLSEVVTLTGLSGRWMTISNNPKTVCDTGHNIGGWQYISRQLDAHNGLLIMILGFVNDKDISHILPLIPQKAHLIYTRASVPRALPAERLAEVGAAAGRQGEVAPTVHDALIRAKKIAADRSDENPLLFVGGSTFIVADLLAKI